LIQRMALRGRADYRVSMGRNTRHGRSLFTRDFETLLQGSRRLNCSDRVRPSRRRRDHTSDLDWDDTTRYENWSVEWT